MKDENKILKPASKEEKEKALEHELGRYKKAAQTRDIVIGELKEEVAGYQETMELLSAFILHLLPENKEVHIKRDDINKIIKTKQYVLERAAIGNVTNHDYILKKVKRKTGN